MATVESVTSTVIDQILIVTLNRPDRRNAVDRATAQSLADAFIAFDRDDSLRVAILTGASGTFCAGADLKAISEGEGNDISPPVSPISRHDPGAPMGPSYLRLGKPVIAAISGHAVAGGLELSLWCDLRVVEESAVLGVFCRRWGVPLVDGGTVRLPRLIGHSHAMDLILTGRSVGAHEALQMGLANRVVPEGCALDEALGLARDISRFPQNCLRSDRQSAIDQWDLSFDDAMANEAKLGLATLNSGESVAGATRFAEGRGRHGAFKDIE